MADYGSTGNVAALVPRYANSSGEFDATTRPALMQVSTFLTQVCAMLNSVLAEEGFSIPITESTVTPMLDAFVNQEVAEIVEGVNGSGRFGPKIEGQQPGRFSIINADVRAFIKGNRVGIERAGADKIDSAEVAEGWFVVNIDRDDSFSQEADGSEYT